MTNAPRSLPLILMTIAASFSNNRAQAVNLPVTTGLVLHLDASDPLNNGGTTLPSNGSSPSGWLDTSGSGNNATIKTSDPNWFADGGAAFNNQPVFRFDGNDAYRTPSDIGVHGAAAATIITVINPTGSSLSSNTRWFGNTGSPSDYFGQNHGGASNTLPTGGAGTSTTNVFNSLGPNNLSGASDTHILSTVVSRFLRFTSDNGVLGITNETDWGAATTISANSGKGVGAFENGGNSQFFFPGDIAEVIVYNRALSNSELAQVETALAAAYNIQLPIPEPGTGVLVMLGGMIAIRRKRSIVDRKWRPPHDSPLGIKNTRKIGPMKFKLRYTASCSILLVLLVVSTLPAAPVIDSSLGVWYDSRDVVLNGVARGAGTIWNDRSGAGNNATLNAGQSFVSETAATGTNIYSETGESGPILPGTQDVLVGVGPTLGTTGLNTPTGLTGATVEVLFRTPRQGSGQNIVNAAGNSGPAVPGPRIWTIDEDFGGGGQLETLFRINTGGANNWYGIQTDTLMPDDEWFHVITKWDTSQDSGELRTWVNGVEVDHSPINGGDSATGVLNPDAFGIPSIATNINSGAAIALTRIYTRGLTDAEVAQNYSDARAFFVAAVPEPSSGGLLLVALAGLGLSRNRRQEKSRR